MSAPLQPSITARPIATDQTLQFFWVNDVSATSYDLSGNGVVTNIVAPATEYTVTGLTNGTPYTYTLVAKNDNGDSPPATFRTVQPGFKPNSPTNITVTRSAPFVAGQVTVNWDYPSPLPVATLLGTVVRAYPLDSSGNLIDASSQGYSVPYGQTSYTLTLPTTSLWNISVRVVNDPGYSPNTTFTGPINTASTSSMILQYDNATYTSAFPFATYYGSLFAPNDTAPDKTIPWGYYSSKQTQYGLIVILATDSPNYSALFITDNNIVYQTPTFNAYANNMVTIGRMNQRCSVVYIDGSDNPYEAKYFTYDWVTRTSYSGTFAGPTVLSLTAPANGSLDKNIAVQTYFDTGKYSYYRFGDDLTAPELIVGPTAGQTKVVNYHEKHAWIAALNDANTQYEQLVYVPNSGTSTIYDISNLGITTLSQFYPLSPNQAVIHDGVNWLAYTFSAANPTTTIDLSGSYVGSGSTMATSAISPYLGGTRSMGAVIVSTPSRLEIYTNVSGGPVAFVESPAPYVVGPLVATSDFAGTIAYDFNTNDYSLVAVDQSGNVATSWPNFGLNFFQISAQAPVRSYNSYSVYYANVAGSNNLYQITPTIVKKTVGSGTQYTRSTTNPASNMVADAGNGDTRWFTDLLPTNLPYYHTDGVYSLYPSTGQTAVLALRLPYADIYKSYTDNQLGLNLDISSNDTAFGVVSLPSAWIVYSLGSYGVRLRAVTSDYTVISYDDPLVTLSTPITQNTDTAFLMALGTNLYTYDITSRTFGKVSLPAAPVAIFTTYEPNLSVYPY